MDKVNVGGLTFRMSISEAEIKERVETVARQISLDMAGKNPLFLSVLNGAFIFTADLLREITIPCEVSFVKLASYEGTSSSGQVRELIGFNDDLTGRHVIIVEDIVDTGLTMKRMLETLEKLHPASVSICAMLVKPEKLKVDLDIRYCAMKIPNDFIVGYGLDYNQQGRQLKNIYTLCE